MRPTGRLHIGHYFGALQNWVRLQNDPSYDCLYFVADWHALTSDYADTSSIAENTMQITIDFLASGLDPAKSVLFQQSQVPEHAELHLLLSMITPLGWLERIPTYKEALENIQNKDLHTYGFLGYPTLQTADIVMYSEPGKGLIVPVGEDQVSHIEFSRELARRFVLYYGFGVNPELFAPENRKLGRNVLFKLLDMPSADPIMPPNAELNAEWRAELTKMSHRIIAMRKLLVGHLTELGTPGDWSHITSQIGMFSYTGLTPAQCDVLIKKHHIFLLSSGRISMAGVNTKNCAYLAQAMDDVVRNVQK